MAFTSSSLGGVSFTPMVARFLRFFAVGTAGTAGYVVLALVLSSALPVDAATALAWVAATVATNVVHRRVTFGVRRARGFTADETVFFLTALGGLGATQGLLALTPALAPFEHGLAIVVGTGVAGVLRFCLMALWVDRAEPLRQVDAHVRMGE